MPVVEEVSLYCAQYIILFPISSALHAENCRLHEEDLRLKAEVQRLMQQNTDLSQVRDHQCQWKDCFMDPFSLQKLNYTGERLFALEREKEHLQPQLIRARQLQAEVSTHYNNRQQLAAYNLFISSLPPFFLGGLTLAGGTSARGALPCPV